jgi:hypothetical protein
VQTLVDICKNHKFQTAPLLNLPSRLSLKSGACKLTYHFQPDELLRPLILRWPLNVVDNQKTDGRVGGL